MFQSSLPVCDALGRLPGLMSQLTGLLTKDEISPGSQVRKPQEPCLGQRAGWDCPGRKTGHQL